MQPPGPPGQPPPPQSPYGQQPPYSPSSQPQPPYAPPGPPYYPYPPQGMSPYPLPPGARGADGCLLACPKCGSTAITKPSMTWWGGFLGPTMFTHRVCGSCRFGFNGKSGKSNQTAITIYVIVTFVIVILLFAARN